MDEATVREMLERRSSTAGAIRSAPTRFTTTTPFSSFHSPAREIRGADDVCVVELSVRYDGGPMHFGVSVHEFRDGKIARETIYVGEGWEAPEWRAQWRSAP